MSQLPEDAASIKNSPATTPEKKAFCSFILSSLNEFTASAMTEVSKLLVTMTSTWTPSEHTTSASSFAVRMSSVMLTVTSKR
jgi:hypothetical protein